MNSPPRSFLLMAINAIGLLGTFFILAGLIWIMYHYTRPQAVEEARWTERKRNLTELRAQNRESLDSYGWLDQSRGVVRLPISRAMNLTIQEWQQPSQGRSNLLARLEKALPPAPAKAPAAPATNAPPAVAPAKK
jgi:hypothetical protein